MMRIAAAFVLTLLAADLASAQARPATCSRDLFQNEAAMRRQQTRLQAVANAEPAAQCAAYREQVRFLQNARAVFATCQSGREREVNVAEMDQSLAEYRALLADRCKGR